MAEAGKLGRDRVLTVRTALDINLQKQAETVIEDQLRINGASYHVKQSATVVLEPNGAVRAIVGGRDYGDSQFNRATKAKRQPGSSFKVYVYATALENGMKPDATVRDTSPSCNNWHPSNYGGGEAEAARSPPGWPSPNPSIPSRCSCR